MLILSLGLHGRCHRVGDDLLRQLIRFRHLNRHLHRRSTSRSSHAEPPATEILRFWRAQDGGRAWVWQQPYRTALAARPKAPSAGIHQSAQARTALIGKQRRVDWYHSGLVRGVNQQAGTAGETGLSLVSCAVRSLQSIAGSHRGAQCGSGAGVLLGAGAPAGT